MTIIKIVMPEGKDSEPADALINISRKLRSGMED